MLSALKSKAAAGKTRQELKAQIAKWTKVSQLDKAAANQLSYDELHAKAKEIDPDIDLEKRKAEWVQFEKDVTAGISNLFRIGFFKTPSGKPIVDKHNKQYNATRVGGSDKSDVKVTNGKDDEFYVECKLNYESASYFKFGIKSDNGKLTYDPRFFTSRKSTTPDKQAKMKQLFSKIGLGDYLTGIASTYAKAAWGKFNDNLKKLAQFMKTDPELKHFASEVNSLSVFPDDFSCLEEVFDKYLDHYVTRYNQIIDSIVAKVKDEAAAAYLSRTYKIYLKKGSDTRNGSMLELAMIVKGAPFKISKDEEVQLDELNAADAEEVDVLADEAMMIESKFNAMLDSKKLPRYAFSALQELVGKDKLKYLFKLFISGQKRKSKAELSEDNEGNMVVFQIEDIKLKDMSKKICQYYIEHGNCQYIQIADTVFQLDKKLNSFKLEDLPLFQQNVTNYSIKLAVSDKLDRISLFVFAVKPKSIKGKTVSFREADANYIGK